MPKIKSHSGAAKRFIKTKSGSFKRPHSLKNHILTKKTTKRKRGLRKSAMIDKTNLPAVSRMLPY